MITYKQTILFFIYSLLHFGSPRPSQHLPTTQPLVVTTLMDQESGIYSLTPQWGPQRHITFSRIEKLKEHQSDFLKTIPLILMEKLVLDLTKDLERFMKSLGVQLMIPVLTLKTVDLTELLSQ